MSENFEIPGVYKKLYTLCQGSMKKIQSPANNN